MKHGLFGWFAISLLGAAPTAEDTSPQSRTPHPKAVKNIHPPGEVDRPEMVRFIVADPASLAGIVVDETAAELVGEWQYSTHTPPYVGLGYLHDMKAGKGTKSVTFTPTLPKAGWYEVRLAHCYNVRRVHKDTGYDSSRGRRHHGADQSAGGARAWKALPFAWHISI